MEEGTEAGAPNMGPAESIGRRIVTGRFAPGTTLPTLDLLADEFAISRLSMREAIKVLAGKGLVTSTPRRGTVVRPRHEWSRLDADVLIWQLGAEPNAAFVRDLFELRRMIEPEAASLAAQRATREGLSEITEAFARMERTAVRAPESIKADVAFHKAILKATGNDFIAALAPAIDASLRLVFKIQRGAWPDPENFIPTHAAVLDSIRRGDNDGARRAVYTLLVSSEADAMDGLRLLNANQPTAADEPSGERRP
ncbi:MAG TPA: FadR/GntR family transcriptional regulator [Bauldia sp.]|nr:FadR/GntR family transcriptional regulator [Bauldia sp.]